MKFLNIPLMHSLYLSLGSDQWFLIFSLQTRLASPITIMGPAHLESK
jgi:hypothetical protein